MTNLIQNGVNMLSSGFNWYGFLIGAGMIICIVIAYFMGKKRGYYSDLVFDIVIFCIPCAIIGARAYFIIFDMIENPETEWTFLKIIGVEDGGLSGLAIYGGLIGACLGSLITLRLQKRKPENKRVSWLQMADLGFVVIILGQAIGRWGNYANQEAYGNLVTDEAWQWFPYAVKIGSNYFQATFFYESMWDLIGFGLLYWLYNGKRKSFDGFILYCYMIWYGIGRFFIEGLRSDSLWLIPGEIRVSQLLSALLVIAGALLIFMHAFKARKADKLPFVLINEDELSNEYYGYEKSILYKRTLEKPEVKPVKKPIERDEVSDDDRYWENGVDNGLKDEKKKKRDK